ncbi:hypothetical protein VP01_81g3 [Puccinia sorghi]|uniref:Uncharacterized protein n=1 Tax=Puccinia sorghi TaxID=27349 RepID=A0A0L6UC53_9BASI|nr:hypothetical protein VP01_81g3 [Puccinia sorghi]
MPEEILSKNMQMAVENFDNFAKKDPSAVAKYITLTVLKQNKKSKTQKPTCRVPDNLLEYMLAEFEIFFNSAMSGIEFLPTDIFGDVQAEAIVHNIDESISGAEINGHLGKGDWRQILRRTGRFFPDSNFKLVGRGLVPEILGRLQSPCAIY